MHTWHETFLWVIWSQGGSCKYRCECIQTQQGCTDRSGLIWGWSGRHAIPFTVQCIHTYVPKQIEGHLCSMHTAHQLHPIDLIMPNAQDWKMRPFNEGKLLQYLLLRDNTRRWSMTFDRKFPHWDIFWSHVVIDINIAHLTKPQLYCCCLKNERYS